MRSLLVHLSVGQLFQLDPRTHYLMAHMGARSSSNTEAGGGGAQGWP